MEALKFTVSELAERIGGVVEGDGGICLTGFAPAESAGAGDLTFAENDLYFERAEQGEAAAILVTGGRVSSRKTVIRVPDARVAFAVVLPLFFPELPVQPGVHPTAVIASTAEVDSSVFVGPGCIIEAGVRIGARSVLAGMNHVGLDCVLGEEVRLYAGAILYPRTVVGDRVRIHSHCVIGGDGFGYVLSGGVHSKIPQVGNVVIGEDVEIGPGTTVDRGALGSTRIGKGTKIDNLVQIGHNVVLGEHCILCAQVGIAGSTRVGNYVVMGGQTGVAGHLEIGDGVTITAQSGVMHNIPSGERWFGAPARPDRENKRQMIAITKLPELLRRVKALEDRVSGPSPGLTPSR